MEEKHKNILRSKRSALMQNISNIDRVINDLYGKALVSNDDKDEIETEKTRNRKIGKILDILPTKGKDAFHSFCDILTGAEEQEAAYILQPESRPTGRGITSQQQDEAGKQDEIELPEDWPNEDAVTAKITVEPCNSEHKRQYFGSTGVYSMEKCQRGRCFILSNKIFDSTTLSNREGTEEDVKRLEELFKELHFEVIIHTDKKAQAVKDELSKEAQHTGHNEAECFVCVICSHGNEEGIFGVDGGIVSLKEITTLFDGRNCSGLQYKPKLFFIQACQGGEADRSNVADGGAKYGQDLRYLLPEIDGTSVSDDVKSNNQQGHTKTDMLVACATHPGYVSFRNTKFGTWFIQAVIYIFQKYACKKDIHGLLTLVNMLVSKGRTERHELQASKFVTSLRKSLYFFPGKE